MNESRSVLIEVKARRARSGLPELRLLSEAAGYEVLREFQQSRCYDSSYCVGKGKAKEIAEEIKKLQLPLKVIVNNQLKPMQKYNLTEALGTEVIDRFQLILEIFTKKAGTVEAKYQIELAKLQYELPLSRENVRLAKIGELPGFHGLGKYQADVYTSMIKRRISYLKTKLDEISKRKSINRLHRRKESLSNIALSGYTFAGKTTLFNRLAQEALPIGDNLFTTLSTTTRAVSIFGRKVLFSDTVGFIDDLPHLLIEAFYSTLEEVTLADRVLLVLDSSDPLSEFSRKLHTCISTLNEIGVFSSSIMPVLNKTDLAGDLEPFIEVVEERLGVEPLRISAKTGEGIANLMEQLSSALPKQERVRFAIPMQENANPVIDWIFKKADVESVKYYKGYVEMEISIAPSFLPHLKRMQDEIEGSQLQLLGEV